MANVDKLQETGRGNVLVLDDDKNFSWGLCEALKDAGYKAASAASSKEGFAKLSDSPVDVVLLDLRLGAEDGVDVLKRVKKEYPDVAVIMITAFGDIPQAVECMRNGAFNFITKTAHKEPELFFATVGNAIESSLSRRRDKLHRQELKRFYDTDDIVASSEGMLSLIGKAAKVAESPSSTVLVTGETGVGKELMARLIHERSGFRDGAFVALNCSALPENLLESELFGYEKGAFTGAVRNAPGLFLEADRGTLLLDEIGEMSLGMQVKLLRVLQDRHIRPVGATRDFEVDVRVIAATNQDLQALVADKRFREDLYYRINVIHLALPPLRERKEDIPILAQHFLAKFCNAQSIPLKKISMDAVRILENYGWPGNVRELENVIERAVALEPGGVLRLSSLPGHLVSLPLPALPSAELPEDGLDLGRHLDTIARHMILQALERTSGNQTAAAKILKMSFRSFRYYVKKFKIKDLVHPGRSAD